MFKYIIPVLLVITSAAAPVPQQSPTSSDLTAGLPNGRFWLRRSQDEKLVWLFGYSDGIKAAAAFVLESDPDKKLLAKYVLHLQPTDQLTPAEIVHGIDHFYQDTPENALVTMVGALNYVTLKAKGAKQSELDNLASGMRKAASSPEKP
ncbi:MAG: hypothetical protein WBS24_06620 [Terriglobales bacterium]